MAIFSVAVRTSITTSPNSSVAILASSSQQVEIFEVGTTLNAATASALGVGRLTTGTTLGTTSNGQSESTSTLNSVTQVGTTWSSQPSAPAQYFRRVSLPATAGAGIIWTFPRGLVLPTSNAISLFNISTCAAQDVWWVWNE